MRIILEVTDFDEHAGPPEAVAEKIERALAFGYTIEVMKVPGGSPWQSEAKFVDVGGQAAHSLVGPVEVTLAPLNKDAAPKRARRPERNG